MNLRLSKGSLTTEQDALIQQAGEATGIAVRRGPTGNLSICDLTPQQIARLAWAITEQWGIPFNSVIIQQEEL